MIIQNIYLKEHLDADPVLTIRSLFHLSSHLSHSNPYHSHPFHFYSFHSHLSHSHPFHWGTYSTSLKWMWGSSARLCCIVFNLHRLLPFLFSSVFLSHRTRTGCSYGSMVPYSLSYDGFIIWCLVPLSICHPINSLVFSYSIKTTNLEKSKNISRCEVLTS